MKRANKKFSKGNVIFIVVVALLLIGLIGRNSGGENNSGSDNSDSQASQTQPVVSDDSSSEDEVTQTAEEATEALADDSVVNDFIVSYNAISGSPFTDIEKGNIRTKYIAYSYTYYFELLHTDDTDKIDVTITETNDNADEGVKGMKSAFHDVALTINPSLSGEEVDAYFDNMVSGNLSYDDTTHGNLSVNQQLDGIAVSYSPDLDLSRGHSRGHIEIIAL
ncbi:MAG: hypothetical protein MR940_08975 [Lachnospiraceae bacterium]|nr:hypothetical protein [Lachnospiraceae bacterium]